MANDNNQNGSQQGGGHGKTGDQQKPGAKTAKSVDDYGAKMFAAAMKVVDKGIKMVDESVEREKARLAAEEVERTRRAAEESAQNARLREEAEARRVAEEAALNARLREQAEQTPPHRPVRDIPIGWIIVIIILLLLAGWIAYSVANRGEDVTDKEPPTLTAPPAITPNPSDICFSGGPVLCRENVQPCCEALPVPYRNECLLRMYSLYRPLPPAALSAL